MSRRVCLILSVFSFLCLLNGAFATTYYVKKGGSDSNSGTSWDEAFRTITKALGRANSGDAVWVAEGTYQEGATLKISEGESLYGGFAGTESDLSELDIENHKTIIDGKESHQCVKNYGLLDGFDITNGKTDDYGGGIDNRYDGTVINCRVYGNKATRGGGIDNHGTVINCEVYDNRAIDFGGGGIENYGKVANCKVYKNISPEDGGGICNELGTVVNCTVYDNTAEDGGGIHNQGNVINCTVYDNTASDDGGGIENWGTVINCTLYKNTATDEGDGINNRHDFVPITVINCISWNHTNEDIRGYLSEVSYSCFGEADGSNHNINKDPKFEAPPQNFRLQTDSPCIDAGTCDGAPETDLDGNFRPQGAACDMGAYEYLFPDNAKFISQSVPEKIVIGHQYQVTIAMKNIGSNTWTKDAGYWLGDIATANSLWGISRVDLEPGESITKNDTKTFTFTIIAPDTAGVYDFQWQMVKEPEDKWFGEKTTLLQIEVVNELPGDVNDDGLLNQDDIDLLKNYIIGKTTLDPDARSRADANKDGKIDVADIIYIILQIAP